MKNQKKNQTDYFSKEKTSRISIDLSTSTERENHEGENERTLFRAIIYQALLDASATEITSKENMVIQQDAVRWFTKTAGVTASWFVDVCDLANLNYSQVREFASRLIREPEKVDFERKRLNVLLNMRHGEDNGK